MCAGLGELAGEGVEVERCLMTMSTLTELGIAEAKKTACDRLLNARVEMKVQVGTVQHSRHSMHSMHCL
jgi:nucleolar GTP-binding protein